jgi:hypothetical protein
MALFGVKPGPYLVVVAAVVKGLIVVGSLVVGARLMRRRNRTPAAATDEVAPSPASPPGPPSPGA